MMEINDQVKEILNEMIDREFTQAILSNPVDSEKGNKIKIRPVMIKNSLCFQETLYKGTQVFHTNYVIEEMKEKMLQYIGKLYKQAEIITLSWKVTILTSKKGKITIQKRKVQNGQVPKAMPLEHNRSKHYVLPEGKPVDFLVGLGVQTKDGKVVNSKYDKFRQINRYLEFIEDILQQLPKDRTIRIIDFGCGKSYLTFAMYYYLHVQNGYDICVTGLDLKEDVIDYCNELAEKFQYENLHFEKGDISTYEGEEAVDMVVSLHACDTATDYALEKAIKWNAKVILAVPCCQHEVNKQISCPELTQVLKYGLIKERISALLTDAVRANLLEEMGYDTQILEFIDMEHTPKNILIRAVKRDGIRNKKTDIKKTTDFLNIETTLQKLLGSNGN